MTDPEKHPHGCGEDSLPSSMAAAVAETGTASTSAPKNKGYKVVIHAECSLGAGHLATASKLCRALEAEGCEVLITTRRMDVAHGLEWGNAQFCHLPPTEFDKVEFRHVVRDLSGPDPDTNPEWLAYKAHVQKEGLVIDVNSDQMWQEHKARVLVEGIQRFAPEGVDCMVWESIPLNLSEYSNEFWRVQEMFDQISPPPYNVCVSMELLRGHGMPFGGSYETARDLLDSRFQGLLFHCDGNFTSPADPGNFPPAIVEDLKHMIACPGYFVDPMIRTPDLPEAEKPVVVTAGGSFSTCTKDFYFSAMDSHEHTALREHPMVIYVPYECKEDLFLEMQQRASEKPGTITVKRNDDRLRQDIADAALLQTFGGVNTVTEGLNADVPMLIYPHRTRSEWHGEQCQRAVDCAESHYALSLIHI